MSSAAIRAAKFASSGVDISVVEERIAHLTANNATTWLFENRSLGDGGVAAVAGALETNMTVDTLFLGGNGIGDAGAAALARALETNTSVATVFLTDNVIGDVGASALATALETNTAVAILSLSSNKIGDTGATALGRALGLTSEQEEEERKKKADITIRHNSSLTKFYINDNLIGDSGARALANGIIGHSRDGGLETFNFHRNTGMTEEGQAFIGVAMSDAKMLPNQYTPEASKAAMPDPRKSERRSAAGR